MDLATMSREDMRRLQKIVEMERQKQSPIPTPTKADLQAHISAEEDRGNIISKKEDADGNVTTFFKELPLNQVPIISWVQAGSFVNPDCQTTPGYAEEFVFYPGKEKSKRMFALRVKNDSMEPEFKDGDIVIIDPDRFRENGDYVVAKNGDEATLKRFVVDGSKYYLMPLNKLYQPIEMKDDNYSVVGVVVYKVKGY
jgi:SOS-response transcriptional repressor LexA